MKILFTILMLTYVLASWTIFAFADKIDKVDSTRFTITKEVIGNPISIKTLKIRAATLQKQVTALQAQIDDTNAQIKQAQDLGVVEAASSSVSTVESGIKVNNN